MSSVSASVIAVNLRAVALPIFAGVRRPPYLPSLISIGLPGISKCSQK